MADRRRRMRMPLFASLKLPQQTADPTQACNLAEVAILMSTSTNQNDALPKRVLSETRSLPSRRLPHSPPPNLTSPHSSPDPSQWYILYILTLKSSLLPHQHVNVVVTMQQTQLPSRHHPLPSGTETTTWLKSPMNSTTISTKYGTSKTSTMKSMGKTSLAKT
jgi:hypothetical protein